MYSVSVSQIDNQKNIIIKYKLKSKLEINIDKKSNCIKFKINDTDVLYYPFDDALYFKCKTADIASTCLQIKTYIGNS